MRRASNWENRGYETKVILGFCFLVMAFFVAGMYGHKCSAGHKGFESSTFWIAAIVPNIILWLIKDFRFSIPLALLIPVALLIAAKPYTDWVHGPNSPWPDPTKMKSAEPPSGKTSALKHADNWVVHNDWPSGTRNS